MTGSTRNLDSMSAMNSELWNQRYARKEFIWSVDPNQFLVAEVKHLPAGRALDVGTGEGRNAVWLAKQGWRVAAIDFSDVGIGKGEQLARSENVSVDWICDDATRYQSPADSFDLIVMLYSISRGQHSVGSFTTA